MTIVFDNFKPVITGEYFGDSNADAIWAGQGMPPGYLENFDFSPAIFHSFEQINYNWMAMDMPGMATFSSSQFGNGLIANNVQIFGAWGRTDLIINMTANGSLDASGWQFMNGDYYSWKTGEDYVFIHGAAGNQTIKGTSVVDTFIFQGNFSEYSIASNASGGLTVTDTVSGRDGVENISGVEYFQFKDVLKSTADLNSTPSTPTPTPSNQTFTSTSANESFVGTGPLDVIILDGNRADYSLLRSGATLTVTDKIAGRDGVDILSGIERVNFNDGHLVFDIPNTTDNSHIYRLYQAAFARTPDEAGDRFWVDALAKGATFQQISSYFQASDEFKSKYGENISDTQFVDLLYKNVLDRAPDAAGYAFWTGHFQAGDLTRVDALNFFSESPENIQKTAGNTSDGYWFV